MKFYLFRYSIFFFIFAFSFLFNFVEFNYFVNIILVLAYFSFSLLFLEFLFFFLVVTFLFFYFRRLRYLLSIYFFFSMPKIKHFSNFFFSFVSLQVSIIDQIFSNNPLHPFFSNGEFWGFIPNSRIFFPKVSFDMDFVVDWFASQGSEQDTFMWFEEAELPTVNLWDFTALGSCFLFFIFLGFFYNNLFRNHFFPLYYYFGCDNEQNDIDAEADDDWNTEHDEEEDPEDADEDLESVDEEFFDARSEHKNQEYYIDWYKEHHPLMYWHLLFTRLFSSQFRGIDVDTTTYEVDLMSDFEEEDNDEIEAEEWESEFDLFVILLTSIAVEGYCFYWNRFHGINERARYEWITNAEQIRVLSSGDLFVFNHTMSNFSELFSNFWESYVVNSWSYSEKNLLVRENYYKLYFDNLLLEPQEHLSYSQIFIDPQSDFVQENSISFEEWAAERHKKIENRLRLYDAVAPPVSFMDLNRTMTDSSVVSLTKTNNLLSLVNPVLNDNHLIYQNGEFQSVEYLAYIKRLQRKLGLINEDFLNKYEWNRKSRYRWMRFRSFPSKEELNTLIEDVRFHFKKSRWGRKKKLRRLFRNYLSKSRVYLGDYLMFLHAYRLHPKRRWTGVKLFRKYANSPHYSIYPYIYRFGPTYSFFSPQSPLFLNSYFENQFQLHHSLYFFYHNNVWMRQFKTKKRFGSSWIRPLILPRVGHLLRDYLSNVSTNIFDSLKSNPPFLPSTYLKLSGLKVPKVSKLYYDDVVGTGRHDWLFLLNDNFWYLWREETAFGLETANLYLPGYINGPFYSTNASDDNIITYVNDYLTMKTSRAFDFHPLYTYEGKVQRFSAQDTFQHHYSKKVRVRFRRLLQGLKKSLRQYIFLQAYVDVLQSKYGSIVGLFMFNSPGNSLNVLSKTLFDFTIDYSWYEKTHYITFPDQSFGQKDVKAMQNNLYGPMENQYNLSAQSYDNPLSSFPPTVYSGDFNIWNETDLFVKSEEALVQETNQNFFFFDVSWAWKGFPFMESKQWPTDKITPQNLAFFEYYAKIINNYRPFNFKNSIVLNYLIDPIGILLTQRELYKNWLSLNPKLLPPSSNFFGAFKYFKNFLSIPDFSYLDRKWNIFFFLEQQRNKSFIEFKNTFISDPEEDFLGVNFFNSFTSYFYDSPWTISNSLPSTSFFDINILFKDISVSYFTEEPLEDFSGCIYFPFFKKYDLIFCFYSNSFNLLFNKTSLLLKQFFSKDDPVGLYIKEKRSIFTDLELKPIRPINYPDDLPPFEDFLQDISYSWWDRWHYFSWPSVSPEVSWLDYFELFPPVFEDFLQAPSLDFSYSLWRTQIQEVYDAFFIPKVEDWWKKAILPSFNSFKKEINFTTGKESSKGRFFAEDAESWYFYMFTDLYEPYLGEIFNIKDYFKKGWLSYNDITPFFQGGEFHTWDIWSMLFASDDDDFCWMLMPFFRYFPVQVGLEHNEFGPYDSQEFSHILHTEPFFLFHDLDLTELEAEVHSKIRDDLEIDMTGNGDWIEFPDYRTSPYRDDEEDSVEEDEDLTELENEGFNARVMASFWRSHYEKFLNYSIDWSQADWITRFVLQCTISRCDDQGSFHLKKLYPSSMYNLETIHGSSIKGRAKPNDVFWNEEGLEEGVLTSYVYPMGRRGAWRGRRGFVPLTVGTYKKGLSFEGLPRDEDTGEWWYDDLDLWDFWRGEIRNGNKLAQTSVDGDFGSFEREVYRDDFVFYKRYFAHKRIAFPRDKGFFSFFVTMEEEDDMDCFEMAWEDEDDFFIYNPYVKSTTGPFYAICPGEAKAFIPQVFRTPAWHGYPVPIDSKGWVYISWLWRFAKADSLSYSLNYQALTYGRGMLKHAGRRSFLSFFADTFGLFTQFYKGQRKRYILRPDHAPHFGRISKLNHDKRMFKSFGADLTYGFWRLFNIDTNIYEDMEGDDAPLADDFWDDEEHPMDCYEEGSEFYVDEAAEAAETFAITPGELGQGKALRHKNRQFTWINYQLKDPYYEEEPYPEAAFEYYLVGSSLPFLKSFEFFKTSYDANIKIPFVMDSMQIKLDRIEWERFPWNVYNFVGERDLNFEQINSVSKPYLFESFDYNYDCRKWWITDLVREWKNKNMAAGKATIEDLEEEKVKVLRVHQRRFRPKFARTFGFASENTLDLQSLSRDYLFLFLTRSVFSSYIQDEVCRSDSLSARYPQQRFIFQETLLAPYINLKSPVFSASWFSEVTKLFNNKKESVWTFLTNKLPYISLNRSKNIEGMRAFIPNKNEYFSYPTYLTTHEENSMIQHFAVSYLTMWQERLRFFTWQYRNMGTNYAGVLHKLKSGSLKCISRFDFSFSRFQKKTLFDVPHGFLSLKTEPSPVGRWIIFKTAAWGSEGYFTFAQWTRSSILYPLVWLSYNINFFSDIPFGFQWELSSWLFEIQALSMFYSFFIMLISWAFLGIHV